MTPFTTTVGGGGGHAKTWPPEEEDCRAIGLPSPPPSRAGALGERAVSSVLDRMERPPPHGRRCPAPPAMRRHRRAEGPRRHCRRRRPRRRCRRHPAAAETALAPMPAPPPPIPETSGGTVSCPSAPAVVDPGARRAAHGAVVAEIHAVEIATA